MERNYPQAKYLVDEKYADYIAEIGGGQVGAIAIAEQLPFLFDKENPMPARDHLATILQRAKRLSASKAAHRAEHLVEVTRAKPDPRLPSEATSTPGPAEGRPVEA